ncbi:hypothetical protein LTR66_000311 [Elasticomyces elasticus]|nr:hypothetical protein LTR66_000311 [Elasticomyces elasticus]KAK5005103.1 hypothetical protein LTR28_008117 [Elasticomyces elasticus]
MSYADLKGKTYIITGASSGMGRTTALLLAQQGANVGLLDLKKPDHVLEEIEKAGGKAISLACDVTNREVVDQTVRTVADKFGQLDGAANMAGYVGNQGFFSTGYALDVLYDKDWDLLIDINLNGTKNCLRAELNHMKGSGSIVNITSIAGQNGPPYNSPYAVAKWGVIGLTKSAAQESGKRNIRVNAVAPGTVETPLVASLGDEKQVYHMLLSKTALKRIAKPEEVSRVILFLLSDQSSYMTASVLNVDAGWSGMVA